MDIFDSTLEQPAIYIADISITASFQISKVSRKRIERKIKMDKYPIVLTSNLEFPTEKTRQNFLRKVFDMYIDKGNYDKVIFTVEAIENAKFSSKLAYFFDYDLH